MTSILRVGLCCFLFSIALLGCASPGQETVPFPPAGKALSPAQLAMYNDSFDRFRDDLYDIAAMTWTEQQMDNLCLGETEVSDGKLWIRTKPGCFSRGGLESKYQIKGSFDIQIDCTVRFLTGRQEIDQIVLFLVTGKGSLTDFPRAGIQLAKFAGSQEATITSVSAGKGVSGHPRSNKINDFAGSLRIIKNGNHLTTLHRKDDERDWTKLGTATLNEDRLRLGFVVRNFTPKTTSVKGNASIFVTVDNLVVNAADEIIEGEI